MTNSGLMSNSLSKWGCNLTTDMLKGQLKDGILSQSILYQMNLKYKTLIQSFLCRFR